MHYFCFVLHIVHLPQNDSRFMRVFYDLENLPTFTKPVLTIGTFDGVHQGHRIILDRIKKRAKEVGGESVIITFDPHPRLVLGAQQNLSLLHTLDEKIESLQALSIDNLVVVNFTKKFAEQSAVEYIQEFLVNNFHPYAIIIGYDHQFGKGRSGDYHLLEQYKHELGYQLEEIPVQELKHSVISSTRIRTAIQTGEIIIANEFLGKPYSFSGLVVDGDKRGRLIGFPTANIFIQDTYKLIPANGVYAIKAIVHGTEYKGMMNIGVRPTIEESMERKIEVHLIDFNESIYGEQLKVVCIDKIRNEIKFDGIEKLIAQLKVDKQVALKLLSNR